MPDTITIRLLGPDDTHVLDRVRPGTFDNPVDPVQAWAFLTTGVNLLAVALTGGEVVGFASGTVLMHPDKPRAFFLNEIAVHGEFRRQGIGTRLFTRLRDEAVERGCAGLWLATEADNRAARALYRKAGGRETGGVVMWEWGGDAG